MKLRSMIFSPAARSLSAAAILAFCDSAYGAPVGTAFTYQGELKAGSTPVSGMVDMKFALYDSPAGVVQVGPTICVDDADYVNGRTTQLLDFGDQFRSGSRFLSVRVRADAQGASPCGDDTGYVELLPRTLITAAPMALHAGHAGSANSAYSADLCDTAQNALALAGHGDGYYHDAANRTGTLPPACLSGTYTGALTLNNPANVFVGQGVEITGVTPVSALSAQSATTSATANAAATLNGQHQSFYRNWANKTGRLPSNMGFLQSGSSAYSSAVTFSNAGNVLTGDASMLNLSAAGFTTGTIPMARFSGAYANVVFTNPQNVYRGDGAGMTSLQPWNLTGVMPRARVSDMLYSFSTSNDSPSMDVPATTPTFIAGTAALINVPFACRATMNWHLSCWTNVAGGTVFEVNIDRQGTTVAGPFRIAISPANVHESFSGTAVFDLPAGSGTVSMNVTRVIGSGNFKQDFNDSLSWSILGNRQ